MTLRLAHNLLPEDGEVRLVSEALEKAAAERLLATLMSETPWRQEQAVVFGRKVALPRLTAWYGPTGYAYSGVSHVPATWTPALLEVKAVIEGVAGCAFDSVLLNLYRDGRDSMGWHSDDEAVLGPDPRIASVSLGATRRFRLAHRRSKTTVSLDLPHGSCLIMAGSCQHHWRHALPKTAKPVGARINLTFRRLGNAASTCC
jgi:alkylated DNA repair dioxygenase AlkB